VHCAKNIALIVIGDEACVLQCVAVCYGALQRIAVYSAQNVSVFCSECVLLRMCSAQNVRRIIAGDEVCVLQCVAVHCSVLRGQCCARRVFRSGWGAHRHFNVTYREKSHSSIKESLCNMQRDTLICLKETSRCMRRHVAYYRVTH